MSKIQEARSLLESRFIPEGADKRDFSGGIALREGKEGKATFFARVSYATEFNFSSSLERVDPLQFLRFREFYVTSFLQERGFDTEALRRELLSINKE